MNQSEPIVYKAAGILKGQYFPSTKFRTGILVTPDGDKLPCNISAGKVAKLLTNDSSLLESQQTWLSYPRVGEESSGFEFDLIDLYHKPERLERLKGKVEVRVFFLKSNNPA